MTPSGGGDRGQATVEMAASMALLAVLAVAMVRVGLAIRDELAVELAAREGARAASVAADPSGAAADAARRVVDLPIDVRAEVVGDIVRVHVSYTAPITSGLLRGLPEVTHRATASMALEPP